MVVAGRLAVLKPIKQDRHLPLRSCQTRSQIGDSRRRKGSLAGPPDHSPLLSNLLRVLNPLYVSMYVCSQEESWTKWSWTASPVPNGANFVMVVVPVAAAVDDEGTRIVVLVVVVVLLLMAPFPFPVDAMDPKFTCRWYYYCIWVWYGSCWWYTLYLLQVAAWSTGGIAWACD